ncbi:Hsp20/alpha crystallin family protein [Lachnoclostridium sp. An181]|uniref:Hsp20/alpha crystallin family protein n=1 Tax=Lachnoclostridium sp. An181 TaxID=1965575 RepID=UPI000B36567E|nr:Hsp20/alpha crystallin family protein [Lachnoclostridium sp. An181]OUP48632.1 heat-shock protein [Lachnoclostridium sp. An181]
MLLPRVFSDDLFDDFFNFNEFPFFDDRDERKLEKKLYGHRARNLMKTDVRETEKDYELIIDLPGFKKDEVKVSLENGYLTIGAEKGLDEEEKEKKTGRYIRRERYAGSCQRSFYVGEDITQDDIKGEFKHGILKLSIPKKETRPAVQEKKYITIE